MSKIINKTIAAAAFLFLFFGMAGVALAADPPVESGTITLCNPLASDCNAGTTGPGLEDIIQRIINWIFNIALIVCPLLIVYGGFIYITSGGSEDKIKEGKRIITYAIIGLVIIIMATGFVALIKSILMVK